MDLQSYNHLRILKGLFNSTNMTKVSSSLLIYRFRHSGIDEMLFYHFFYKLTQAKERFQTENDWC